MGARLFLGLTQTSTMRSLAVLLLALLAVCTDARPTHEHSRSAVRGAATATAHRLRSATSSCMSSVQHDARPRQPQEPTRCLSERMDFGDHKQHNNGDEFVRIW